MKLEEFLTHSYTAYHASAISAQILADNGFKEIKEYLPLNVIAGGKYYVKLGESALAAFTLPCDNKNDYYFKISASHTDSPCFKIKNGGAVLSGKYRRLDVESYGGAIDYTWFDRQLKIAGRVVIKQGDVLVSKLYESSFNVVIPSVAVHLNREVNKNFSVNVQNDMQPLFSLDCGDALTEELNKLGEVVDYDLYAVCAQPPFNCGANAEFISAPRLDNLVGVYSSVSALCSADNKNGVNLAVIYDSEEIGSATVYGAGSTFLARLIERINNALGKSREQLFAAMANSVMLSVDNAHAAHPNRAELSSPNNKFYLGDGVAIKHHGGMNYTTDGLSSAIVKTILNKACVKYGDFYMRSDLACGRTLGASVLGSLSVTSADIGVVQLAMHSAVETASISDCAELFKCLTAFYNTRLQNTESGLMIAID